MKEGKIKVSRKERRKEGGNGGLQTPCLQRKMFFFDKSLHKSSVVVGRRRRSSSSWVSRRGSVVVGWSSVGQSSVGQSVGCHRFAPRNLKGEQGRGCLYLPDPLSQGQGCTSCILNT